MATIVEIGESKLECLSEYVEKMLKFGGKVMSCIEDLKEELEELKSKSRKKKHIKDEEDEDYLRYY